MRDHPAEPHAITQGRVGHRPPLVDGLHHDVGQLLLAVA